MKTMMRVLTRSLLMVSSAWLCTLSAVASEFSSTSFPHAPFTVNGAQTFLPVDQAFQFTALSVNEQLLLRWQIAPGYYLYRDRLRLVQDGVAVQVVLPEGVEKLDETFGLVRVYHGTLELAVPLNAASGPVQVEYQGCAEAGLCYPPRLQSVPLG
ncbi:MAG: protein-disulfide reductase DsbD family protein [SAR86 cluster bacterium]|jgi:thiol:disulfide interchange protein DsbD|uniref:Thiol:disulfide interchange protein DsbD N-terminal domain-containing protein n=1 Tax=SAR86 cluster bacterium TaxID=2030880 RepID=A0A972VV06_9GAMM|nr:hypothetical protein [SAR86 cluster bacterium]